MNLRPTAGLDTNSEMILSIPGMDCASEQLEIEAALDGIEGISTQLFNLSKRTLVLSGKPQALTAAQLKIQQLGYRAEIISDADKATDVQKMSWKRLLFSLFLSLLVAFLSLSLRFTPLSSFLLSFRTSWKQI